MSDVIFQFLNWRKEKGQWVPIEVKKLKEEEGRSRMRTRRNPIYKRILSEIEREVQIHPRYADLQNQFALLWMVEGEMEKAENHFLEALRLNPKVSRGHSQFGFFVY